MPADERTEAGRGREADWPSEIPARGWKDVLWRVYQQVLEDRVTLVAAGAAFYLMLAIFPALGAFVSIYGFVADPTSIAGQIQFLQGVLPSGGLDLIYSQLESLTSQDPSALSIGLAITLAVSLWSANNGVKTLFEALNIAYEEEEKRSFVKLNLVAFAFTLGFMVAMIVMIAAIGVVPAVLAILNLGGLSQIVIAVGRWVLVLGMMIIGISLLYRFGPSREPAKWRWINWGSIMATLVWLMASIGFSYYLQNFADYNATYGSLGAVIGFMLWIWLSAVILIVGAELNAEMEHQTARDTTTGEERPMGERGATVADTLGKPMAD
ncbi:YihY/virulence factor BrkB family protein [Aquibium microcysteis]|uniref:YihY/virulence factor BrkB family protein n=1 Tax=Aquibium microcysteis TaxID=675281 RepID=UPI00165CF1D9|nr:YihY/virulence factor BrkB family protein [Aquibium microcysteis]